MIVEAVDVLLILLTLAGLAVHAVNLREVLRDRDAWRKAGYNGLVEMTLQRNLRHELLRVVMQTAFLYIGARLLWLPSVAPIDIALLASLPTVPTALSIVALATLVNSVLDRISRRNMLDFELRRYAAARKENDHAAE